MWANFDSFCDLSVKCLGLWDKLLTNIKLITNLDKFLEDSYFNTVDIKKQILNQKSKPNMTDNKQNIIVPNKTAFKTNATT